MKLKRYLSTLLAVPALLLATAVPSFAAESNNKATSANVHSYYVFVMTDSSAEAATNSNVKVKLHGSNGDSAFYDLGNSLPSDKAVALHFTSTNNLGDVESIEVYSDGSGSDPDLKVREIVLYTTYDQFVKRFFYDEWIGDHGPETAIFERRLVNS